MMMNESSILKSLAAWAALLALSATAAPQPIPELNTASERPWARGVSVEAQEAARRVFLEGNDLLKQVIFLQAIEKYRAALKHWDHPAIHYNLALALVNVEPLEGYRHMKEAIRYGPQPLDEQKIEHARTYITLLEKQSARVEITCEVPGASVRLDGKPLFEAPGRYEGLVQPGPHSIVAVKKGFLSTEKSLNLRAGEEATIGLKLYTEAELTRYRTRWTPWMPWAVLGAGATVALSGGVVHMQAGRSYRIFDEKLQARCSVGCVPESEVAQWRARGDGLQSVAYGTYVLGGAALATGAVLVYLNQPEAQRIDPEQGEERVAVAPWLGGGVSGAVAIFRF